MDKCKKCDAVYKCPSMRFIIESDTKYYYTVTASIQTSDYDQ